MKEHQDMIGNWHVTTYGREPMSATRMVDKWKEEARELLDELRNGTRTEKIHEEMADCAILLLAMAHREGVELESLITAKFDIVRNRDQKARDIERGIPMFGVKP